MQVTQPVPSPNDIAIHDDNPKAVKGVLTALLLVTRELWWAGSVSYSRFVYDTAQLWLLATARVSLPGVIRVLIAAIAMQQHVVTAVLLRHTLAVHQADGHLHTIRGLGPQPLSHVVIAAEATQDRRHTLQCTLPCRPQKSRAVKVC